MVKAHWYELTNRGISVGTQPRQGFLTNHLTHVNAKGFDFGAVAYVRELTEKEVYDYELKAIEDPRELNEQETEMLFLLS